MTNLPSGTVTFLFTDIEGSTKLAQQYPDAMPALLARHHEILHQSIRAHNGYVFQIIGDAFAAAFHTAPDALKAALVAQRALVCEAWDPAPIKVRMGIHTGAAQAGVLEERAGGYVGYLTLTRVQRVMSTAHGGQILLSNATAELVRAELPEQVSLRDMGEHHLKGLANLDHLWQPLAPDLPADFPPLHSLNSIPNNLPVQLTSFIGREKEMVEIKQALAEHRLVTVTGSGGAGKSRISLQVASDSLDLFPNGIWFIELAPLSDADLIPQTILSAAGIQPQQGHTALESLIDYLREKASLLVLDNCEHLIEACARFVDTLLNAAPKLKILASSREALRVKGEQAWRVPSLSAPNIKHPPPLEQLLQYESVRLFIDRALLVQPHFVITNENAPAVAQICYRLDGIPLAIELAAARLHVLSAEQIAERLDDRFHLLTGSSRTALPRQQTLRAMIHWSYDLLTENEQTLLRRLAVFSGGCTLESIEQVCADVEQNGVLSHDVLDLLTHLVDKSLVVADEQSGHHRYRLLETVRQYAREKLTESIEGDKIRSQHFSYFLKFAEEAEPHLFRKEQLEWFDRLALDHDNFRAALEWAISSQQPEAGLQFANALFTFWDVKDLQEEAREWFARVIEIPAPSPHTRARAKALYHLAECMEAGRNTWKQMLKLYDESLAIYHEFGDQNGRAEVLLRRANLFIFYLQDCSTAKSSVEESLALYRDINDRQGVSRALFMYSVYALNCEADPTGARKYFEESLNLRLETGDRRSIAQCLHGLGAVMYLQGDIAAARSFWEKSIRLLRELGNKSKLSEALNNLANVAMGEGDPTTALKLLEEVLSIGRELGRRAFTAVALVNLGWVARYQGNYEQARNLLQDGQLISQEMDLKWLIVIGLQLSGDLDRLQGNHETARASYTDGITIAQEIKDFTGIYPLLEGFALLYSALGKPKQAAILLSATDVIRKKNNVLLLPVERAELDECITALRTQLGNATFDASWAEGNSMTLEQAITFALEENL